MAGFRGHVVHQLPPEMPDVHLTPTRCWCAVTLLAGQRSRVLIGALGAPDFAWFSFCSAGLALTYAALWAAGRNRHQFAAGV